MSLWCIYNIISGNTINFLPMQIVLWFKFLSGFCLLSKNIFITILASVLEILYGVDLVMEECSRHTLYSCIKYVRSCFITSWNTLGNKIWFIVFKVLNSNVLPDYEVITSCLDQDRVCFIAHQKYQIWTTENTQS